MNTNIKSILLVDDDTDDCELFLEALNEVSKKCQVQAVHNCRQMIEQLRCTPRPDVIVMDMNMPAKNGLECLKELKEDENLKPIPVIIFSTSSQQETIDKVYEHGAHHYMTKPCSFEKLKQIVYDVVRMVF